MAQHAATITWNRQGAAFTDNRYSRRHLWEFDGGTVVPASASPHVVPMPMSAADAVDPEEAFIASLSSCHLLWFLSIAAERGYIVDTYRDQAIGILSRNAEGKLAMTSVTLHPEVVFSGSNIPTKNEIDAMHHDAHSACFIANSVKTSVRCEPICKT